MRSTPISDKIPVRSFTFGILDYKILQTIIHLVERVVIPLLGDKTAIRNSHNFSHTSY